MATFSERLKQLRTEAGAKQSDIAAMVGVSVQSFSSYEIGREPKYAVLAKLAKHFDCTTDYLLGLSDLRNSDAIVMHNESAEAALRGIDNIPPDDRARIYTIIESVVDSYLNIHERDNADKIREHLLYCLRMVTMNIESTTFGDPSGYLKVEGAMQSLVSAMQDANESTTVIRDFFQSRINERVAALKEKWGVDPFAKPEK